MGGVSLKSFHDGDEKDVYFFGTQNVKGETMKFKSFFFTLLLAVAFVFAQEPSATETGDGASPAVDLSVFSENTNADANDASAKSAASEVGAKKEDNSSWTWRAWTRLASFSIAALCVGGGIFENFKAESRADDYNNSPESAKTYSAYKAKRDDIKNAEFLRNVLYGAAGGAAIVGLTTFAF